MTPGENFVQVQSCLWPDWGSTQSRFAWRGLAATELRLRFPAVLGAGAIQNVFYPHPNPGLLELRNSF